VNFSAGAQTGKRSGAHSSIPRDNFSAADRSAVEKAIGTACAERITDPFSTCCADCLFDRTAIGCAEVVARNRRVCTASFTSLRTGREVHGERQRQGKKEDAETQGRRHAERRNGRGADSPRPRVSVSPCQMFHLFFHSGFRFCMNDRTPSSASSVLINSCR